MLTVKVIIARSELIETTANMRLPDFRNATAVALSD